MSDFHHIPAHPLSELEMKKMIVGLQSENAALREALNNAIVLLRRWNKNDVTDDIVVETRKAICAVLKDTKS